MKFKQLALIPVTVLCTLWSTGYSDETVQRKCVCDTCSETNYTCLTKESCITTLKRHFLDEDGFITRECIMGFVDQIFLCDYPEEDEAYEQYLVQHCCDYDFCNRNVSIAFSTEVTSAKPLTKSVRNFEQFSVNVTKVIAAAVCAFAFAFVLGILVINKFRRNVKLRPDAVNVRGCEASSGASKLLLVQSTIARKITLVSLIGRGSFSQVYLAKFNGQNVAVKSFNSPDGGSWARETDVYQTVMLRHENILGFIASDCKDNGYCTQLWLITDYHKNGSLFDYLQKVTLDVPELLKLALTAARGLAHLHREVTGVVCKPAMAHRDIKSKNILVKEDGTCCIADLGLAVCKTHSSNIVGVPINTRVGTTRYLAPEFLGDLYTVSCFDGYKRADVYSFGLVLWEMTRRCSPEGVCEEYQLPFYDKVHRDPSVEEAYYVVCTERYRPLCPDRWQLHPTLEKMSAMMKECWKHDPLGRVTAARMHHSLQDLTELKI